MVMYSLKWGLKNKEHIPRLQSKCSRNMFFVILILSLLLFVFISQFFSTGYVWQCRGVKKTFSACRKMREPHWTIREAYSVICTYHKGRCCFTQNSTP